MWDNLVDTFKSGYCEGDPGVRQFDREPVCSRCRTSGDHWTRGCPTKASSASSGTDDAIVSSLFCRVLDQPEEQIDLARRLFEL